MPRRRVFTPRCGVISLCRAGYLCDDPATSGGQGEKKQNHRKNHGNPQQNHRLNRLTINGQSTGHQDNESTTIPTSDPSSESSPWYRERSVERVVATEPQTIRRASRRHRAANEPPPRYSQAIRPPPGLHRTNRRSAGPAPRIDDTPQRRVRRPWIGKETEGYVRSSRV